MRTDDASEIDPDVGARARVRPNLTFAFATSMTLTAGFLDAVGYTNLAGLYVSFMSGNSTRFGIAIVQGDHQILLPCALVIASFVGGAFLGSLVGDIIDRFKLVVILTFEIALLLSAIALSYGVDGYIGLLPVCIAMGMQNAAHESVAGVEIGKSFVTGFLFGFGKALAQSVRSQSGRTQVLVYGVSWASFLGGVTLGSLALAHLGLAAALSIACLVLGALAIGATLG